MFQIVLEKFAEDLGTDLGIEVEVFLGTDYNAVIEAMRTENIDIAFLDHLHMY